MYCVRRATRDPFFDAAVVRLSEIAAVAATAGGSVLYYNAWKPDCGTRRHVCTRLDRDIDARRRRHIAVSCLRVHILCVYERGRLLRYFHFIIQFFFFFYVILHRHTHAKI